MIDKDQKAILEAMIKTTYTPVILRTIINLVFLDISKIRESYKVVRPSMMALLDDPKVAGQLIKALDLVHYRQKDELIDEIIKQYDLSLNKDEIDFYHECMGKIFGEQLMFVKTQIDKGAFVLLYKLSQSVE